MLPTCLCIFLVICAPGVLTTALKRRDFAWTLPLSIFSLGLIVYLFGLCDRLRVGVYAVLTLTVLLYGWAVIALLRRQGWKGFWKDLFSPAFVLFFLCFGCMTVCLYGKLAYRIDEFTHWADIVKAMTQVDAFGLHPAAHSAYGGYPPGMAVLQYFAQVVYQTVGGGEYAEWLTYLMYCTAALCLFFPFARGLSWKPSIQHLLFVFAALGLPLVFYPEYYYMTVYIDPFLGLLAGFLMIYPLLDLSRGALGLATFCVGLAMLVLTKDVGALFAAIALLIYLLALWGGKGGLAWPRKLGASLCAVGALFLARLSWSVKTNGNLTGGSSFSLASLIRVLTGNDPADDYRRDIITRFFDALFHPEMTVGDGNSNLLVSYGLVIALLLGAVCFLAHREKNRAAGRAVTVGVLVAASVYVLGMCYMYMFLFSYGEGRQLLQMDRYMGILCLALLGALTFRLLDVLPKLSPTPWMKAALVGLCLLVPQNALYGFVSRQNVRDSYAMRWTYDAYAECIRESVDDSDATVYAVCRDHFDNWFMRLCVRPLHMEQTGDPHDFSHVWLCHPPSNFRAEYGSLFETEADIGEHRLYRWTEEGKLRWVPFP